MPFTSSAFAVTALAGGGQAGAPVLHEDLNRVDTVATAGDSVCLPPSTGVGMECVVINATNNALQVFGSGTDTVNGVASISQPANSARTYICGGAGTWYALSS